MTRAFSTLLLAHDIFTALLAPCPISPQSLLDSVCTANLSSRQEKLDMSRAA